MSHIPELEHFALMSKVRNTDQALAVVDGVLNLLRKAHFAIDAGPPEGRERASVLLGRAERLIPDDDYWPENTPEGAATIRSSIAVFRQSLAAGIHENEDTQENEDIESSD